MAEALATFAARVAEGYAPMQPALGVWENGDVDVGPSPALVGTEGMAAWVDLPLTLTPCPMCPGPIATENADLAAMEAQDAETARPHGEPAGNSCSTNGGKQRR